MEDGGVRQQPDGGRGGAGLEVEAPPPDLLSGPRIHARPEGLRHQLGAEAHAEGRAVVGEAFRDEGAFVREVGVGRGVREADGAAEDDEEVRLARAPEPVARVDVLDPMTAGTNRRRPDPEVLEKDVAQRDDSHASMLSAHARDPAAGTKGLGAVFRAMTDSKVRFDPRATAKNRWDFIPSNCIQNILIPSIRNVSGDRAVFRGKRRFAALLSGRQTLPCCLAGLRAKSRG